MWISFLVHAFRMWRRSRKDIRELAAHDEHGLRDIGVNRREIPRTVGTPENLGFDCDLARRTATAHADGACASP